MLCTYNGHVSIIQHLPENSANVNSHDKNIVSVLSKACEKWTRECCAALTR